MGWNKIAAEMLETIKHLENDWGGPEFDPYWSIYRQNEDARALLAFFLESPRETPSDYDRSVDYAELLNAWCHRNKP